MDLTFAVRFGAGKHRGADVTFGIVLIVVAVVMIMVNVAEILERERRRK